MSKIDQKGPWSDFQPHPLTTRQLRLSNVPRRFLGWSYLDLQPYEGDVMGDVLDWVASVGDGKIVMADGQPACGIGLRLVGKPGHGKTALAAVIAQHLIYAVPQEAWQPIDGGRVNRPVYFASYPDILRIAGRAMKDDGGDDSILLEALFGESSDKNGNVRVLVIDDLGKEHRTASHWAENLFDHLLRRRYDLGLPTIVTSNVAPSQWGTTYGEAMESFAREAFHTSVIISPEGDRR